MIGMGFHDSLACLQSLIPDHSGLFQVAVYKFSLQIEVSRVLLKLGAQ